MLMTPRPAEAGSAADVPPSVAGITAPVRAAQLSALIPGTVAQCPVEEGAAVAAGDLLVQLDQRLEQLEVERRKVIADNKAELDAARMRMDLLKAEFETTRRLFETTKSVSQEDRDRKELEYKLASAEFTRVQAVEMQEELEFRMAQEQLSRREIRAPFAGVVTKVFLQEGEACDPRQPLVELVDASECEFVCNASPAQAATFRPDQQVGLEVESPAGPVARSGRVFFVSPVVDPASGLQEVRVRFDNRDRAVAPGVTARLLLEARPAE